MNAYVISSDTPQQQKELYSLLQENYGESLPFISDPELELIEKFNMKNGEAAYRGYGMLDADGNVVFNTINDHWGEELSKTLEEINTEYEKLKDN